MAVGFVLWGGAVFCGVQGQIDYCVGQKKIGYDGIFFTEQYQRAGVRRAGVQEVLLTADQRLGVIAFRNQRKGLFRCGQRSQSAQLRG